MITPEHFISIASLLDPLTEQCPIIVRRNSFLNLENENQFVAEMNGRFFNGEEIVSISRQNIFDIDAVNDVEKFIVSVLYWGFPTNMHGICRNVFALFPRIRCLTLYILTQPNVSFECYMEHIYPIMRGCRGVKMAFFSKLFYFCRMSINENPCLILDSFVYSGLGCVDDAQFAQIQREARGYNNSFMPYYSYIQGIKELTNRYRDQYQVRGDQIEYILFKLTR